MGVPWDKGHDMGLPEAGNGIWSLGSYRTPWSLSPLPSLCLLGCKWLSASETTASQLKPSAEAPSVWGREKDQGPREKRI
jgi:hypothetical protein